MSSARLPDRASLEYLRKLSKERLRELRRTDAEARLSDAHLQIAREHGFTSWRALKAEVERRRSSLLETFFAACAAGDVEALRSALARDPSLVRERDGDGTTGLHLAVGHAPAVRLLLEHGADPNARDRGDHALPLHFAAGGGHLESARALLEAGSDVHGSGDAHRLDVNGWATVFATVFAEPHREVVDLLVAHGARHHVFSAIALGDVELLRRVVEADAAAADALAPLRGYMGKLVPMLSVPDLEDTIAWYEALGFVLAASHADGGRIDWASLRLGQAEVMLGPAPEREAGGGPNVSLWIRTDRLDELYALLRERQLARARAALAGEAAGPEVRFSGDLYTAFYGQREFSVRDPNGVEVNFFQPLAG